MTHHNDSGDLPIPIVGPRRTERLAIAAVIIAALAVGIAGFALIGQYHANHGKRQAQKGTSAAVQALGTANSSLARNGLSPVPTPTAVGTVVVTEQGRPGATGAGGPGPSVSQIQDAVDFYCATARCGSGPTAAQVAQAVATYCDSRGHCQGPSGGTVTGSAGPQGVPGQNATADQVAAAVATWCTGHGNCQGPEGSSGPAGAPGASGSAGSDGQPPVSWTYTDALGISHTCRRTEDFNPAAPTYTCN